MFEDFGKGIGGIFSGIGDGIFKTFLGCVTPCIIIFLILMGIVLIPKIIQNYKDKKDLKERDAREEKQFERQMQMQQMQLQQIQQINQASQVTPVQTSPTNYSITASEFTRT